MPPRWPSRISGAFDGSGDTDFAYAGLWLQQAVLTPCRALPVPNLLPGHRRAAATSPESWGVQAGRVPCAPSCYCHLEHMAASSPPQPGLARVAPGDQAAMASLAQPLPAPVEINPGPGSVLSTLAVVFQLFVQLPTCRHGGLHCAICTVAGDAALGELPEGTGMSQSSEWGQPAPRPLLCSLMQAQVHAGLFGWSHPAPGWPGPPQGA